MTITQKNSGSNLKSLADAPVVTGPGNAKPDVLIKMIKTGGGYNGGETVRVKHKEALFILNRGWGVAAEKQEPLTLDEGLALNRAIKLVTVAGDARKLLNEQTETAELSYKAAEEAVEVVMNSHASAAEKASGPRLILEEIHEAESYKETEALDGAKADIIKGRKAHNAAIKKEKTAKNKTTAKRVVAKAQLELSEAEERHISLEKLIITESVARINQIESAKAVEDKEVKSSTQSVHKLNAVIEKFRGTL